jgi:hypothetical protein
VSHPTPSIPAAHQDVAVNVVGKYRYRMTSPADSAWVPLIIDIILVGRTKIITLHSGIWLENAIDRWAGRDVAVGGMLWAGSTCIMSCVNDGKVGACRWSGAAARLSAKWDIHCL